jgi:hypothetical protein
MILLIWEKYRQILLLLMSFSEILVDGRYFVFVTRDEQSGPGTKTDCFSSCLFAILLFCSYVLPDNNPNGESPLDAILGIIHYYVLIGFLSIFFYWVAWSSWIIAAERQVRRIRFVIMRIEV